MQRTRSISRTARRRCRVRALCAAGVLVAAPLRAQQSGGSEQPIQPSRPVIANAAEVQKPGVLQLEVGYTGYRRAQEFRDEQSTPVSLRFAASRRVLVAADVDAVKSQLDKQRTRATGIGDTWLGAKGVAVGDAERHPALAVAYWVKLPTASERDGLGTGRVDHRAVLLASRKLGKTDIDLNGAYLNVGREGSGRTAGGQVALSVGREPEERGLGVQAEIAAQNQETMDPRGTFALGALTYHLRAGVRLDAGVRAGLTHESPRLGVFAGMTTAVADLYGRR